MQSHCKRPYHAVWSDDKAFAADGPKLIGMKSFSSTFNWISYRIRDCRHCSLISSKIMSAWAWGASQTVDETLDRVFWFPDQDGLQTWMSDVWDLHILAVPTISNLRSKPWPQCPHSLSFTPGLLPNQQVMGFLTQTVDMLGIGTAGAQTSEG